MTSTISRFDTRLAPCGRHSPGERYASEDQLGLVTEAMRFECGCRIEREEFHDGSVHHLVVHHRGEVLQDEEFRGE
jgi:hypothetical protein